MGFWCILSFGFSCSAVLHAGDGPVEVVYTPGDTLTVELHFLQVPRGYVDYNVRTQYSDVPVSSGFSDNDIRPFTMLLSDIHNQTILKTSLERRRGKHKLFQKIIKLTMSNSLIARNRPSMEIFRNIVIFWRPAVHTSADILTAYGMQSAPRFVQFKDGDVFKFILKFNNLPKHDSLYANIFLESDSSVSQLVKSELRLDKNMDGSNLTLQMCFIIDDYNKTDTLTIIRLIYDEDRPYYDSCLEKSCEISLDWENQYLSNIGSPAVKEPTAALQRYWRWPWSATGASQSTAPHSPPVPPKPRVTPERFVDDGGHFAVFTCHSPGRHRDLLSWYQIKGKQLSSQLVMKQFSRDTSKTGMLLVLNKTLTTSDKDSRIYCMRRPEVGPPIFSDHIYLNSSRDLPKENLYITVQPAVEVATFRVNTTRSFECGGSQPVDGRSFNWYIEDIPSTNNFSHAPAEKMGSNARTRHVNLTLDLNESYHLKRIYCVQEYHMTLESINGYYYWQYGEKARSNEILLSMVLEDQFTDSDMLNGSKVFPTYLIYVILGVAFVILATGTALVILRRYRSNNRSQDNNNESIYATAEITYAELQLSESNNIIRREEATPYAEVIGSCRPKDDNHYASPVKT